MILPMRRKADLREFVVLENVKDLQSACSSSMLIFLIVCYWHEIDSCVVLFCLFFFSAANVVLTFGHLGLGPTSSSLVLPRISQMCTTSKQHMYRCTMTWSARTRNCIPLHTHLFAHIPAHGTLGDQISTHGSQHCVLFRNVLWLEILRAWRHVNPAAKTVNRCLTHVQGLYTHTHTHALYQTHGVDSTLRYNSCKVVSTIWWRYNHIVCA